MSSHTLAPGLLLAAPRLGDPNFERSVVLLGHHDETGALGWVLNGRVLVPVRQLLGDADLVPDGVELPADGPFGTDVRIGGPVMPGSAWILFERKPGTDPYPGEHDLGGGYAVTAAREAVEAVARGEGPAKFRIFLGYAGWGPQQVEGEIAAGAWLPTEADVGQIFQLETNELWDVSYRMSVGTSPMAFNGATRGLALGRHNSAGALASPLDRREDSAP